MNVSALADRRNLSNWPNALPAACECWMRELRLPERLLYTRGKDTRHTHAVVSTAQNDTRVVKSPSHKTGLFKLKRKKKKPRSWLLPMRGWDGVYSQSGPLHLRSASDPSRAGLNFVPQGTSGHVCEISGSHNGEEGGWRY